MGSHLFLFELPSAHEPKSALQGGSGVPPLMDVSFNDFFQRRDAAATLRFMGSGLELEFYGTLIFAYPLYPEQDSCCVLISED